MTRIALLQQLMDDYPIAFSEAFLKLVESKSLKNISTCK